MRFDLATLIAISTASAFQMAMFAWHPVAAVSCSTLAMTLFLAVRWLRTGSPRGTMLDVCCTFAGFAWMMTFVAATMVAHAAYYTFIAGWPPSEAAYVDMPTAIVLIVAMYGGCAAIGGLVLGLVSVGFARVGVFTPQSLIDR